MNVIIAIDGPAGSGKSTVARLIAQRLGYVYIETGAMYRAIALLAVRRGIETGDAAVLEALARDTDLQFIFTTDGNRLLADGEDVSEAIRTPEVTQAASLVSTVLGVRRALVRRQREMGREGGVVMEGRDIGTKVFPDAQVKLFLDARPDVRAGRRSLQAPDETVAEMAERDRRDRQRAESPLVQAPDAVYLDTSALTVEQVVEAVLKLVEERTRA